MTYYMHMYGSELSDLNCNNVKDFRVAWRKVKRRIWKLPYRAHNAIVHNFSYDIDQLDTRMLKFVHLGLNHSNNVFKSILLSKLCCSLSTFASNYMYLSSKYKISHNDWFTDVSQLISKVRMKFQQNSRSSNEVQFLIELCAIRDGLSTCNTLSHTDVCHLIELISLE